MATIEVKCDKCSTVHSYGCSNLDWECVNSNERSMGPESEHQATIEDTCLCGQVIIITFSCWEYPAGANNMSEVEIDGAIIIKNECPSCPEFH